MENESIASRIKHAWSVFLNRDPTTVYRNIYPSYYGRPDRTRFSGGNERTIATSVYNRMAMDAASVDIIHARLDDEDRYIETIKSSLNNCLTVEANLDQTGRAFLQDVFMSMLDEGCVAIVPTDTTFNPKVTGSYDILTMRTGKIVDWYPDKVKVRLYNEKTGNQEEIELPKSMVAIVENPLYAVINERNSTMQRLIRKLALLDAVDEQSSSGKLDMIIQLPYTIKSESRRAQAESRRRDIMEQIKGPLGIAYTDGTEKIIQLNRPIENNLLKQIEYLTSMLYSQLGITQSIMDGTANEETMLNYFSRTIEPMVSAVVDEMKRKFLTKTARSQKQSIIYLRDLFKFAPMSKIAEIAGGLTEKEIFTSNEVRQMLGRKPAKDPRADQLVNSNINPISNDATTTPPPEEMDSGSDDATDFWNTPISELQNSL